MEKESIAFGLIAIKTEQFAIFDEKFSPKKEINLSTNLEFKINTLNHQFGVFATFLFEQGKNVFIKFQVSCHFSIQEIAWNSFIKENQISFPKGFVQHLSVITIGTGRGVLHTKTEGTPFNSFILPTIDVTKIVDKDAVFEL